jgi:hypothetical protein
MKKTQKNLSDVKYIFTKSEKNHLFMEGLY